MEKTDRHVRLAALIGGKHLGRHITLVCHLLCCKFQGVAESAQTPPLLYMVHNILYSRQRVTKLLNFF